MAARWDQCRWGPPTSASAVAISTRFCLCHSSLTASATLSPMQLTAKSSSRTSTTAHSFPAPWGFSLMMAAISCHQRRSTRTHVGVDIPEHGGEGHGAPGLQLCFARFSRGSW